VDYPGSNTNGVHTGTCCSPYTVLPMVVKKILSSRLIMNSRWLWNSHQRHKFLRAKASRYILKFRLSEMAISRGFQEHVVLSEYMQDWEQCRRNVPGVPQHRMV